MITSYHRPHTLDDALALLTRPDAVVLAGGTSLVADRDGPSRSAVDLQELPIRGIGIDGTAVRLGATATLQDVVDADPVPDLIADLARREAPRSIRNAATVGGTVAVADSDSELVAGLLAHGASVVVARSGGSDTISLEDLLADRSSLSGGIITEVFVPTSGRSAADRTGRTPADRPVVAAVAHRGPDGTSVALTGVAEIPVLVDPDDLDSLDPPSDFRGTAEYRRRLASILVQRVLAATEVAR